MSMLCEESNHHLPRPPTHPEHPPAHPTHPSVNLVFAYPASSLSVFRMRIDITRDERMFVSDRTNASTMKSLRVVREWKWEKHEMK